MGEKGEPKTCYWECRNGMNILREKIPTINMATSATAPLPMDEMIEQLHKVGETINPFEFSGVFVLEKPTEKMFAVNKIIVNGDATIVFWADGDKTIVKKSADDEFDLHHAFCAALAKKIYGHNSTVKKMIERKTKIQSLKHVRAPKAKPETVEKVSDIVRGLQEIFGDAFKSVKADE